MSTLQTLITALLDQPANTRVFEGLDGLLTVTGLFKSRHVGREVKLKLVEFLYFYLGAEEEERAVDVRRGGGGDGGGGQKIPTEQVLLGGRGRELAGAFRKEGRSQRDSQSVDVVVGGPVGGTGAVVVGQGQQQQVMKTTTTTTRTPEEKQALLARYLSNVQDLVEDMAEAQAQQQQQQQSVGGRGVAGLLSRGNGSPVRA